MTAMTSHFPQTQNEINSYEWLDDRIAHDLITQLNEFSVGIVHEQEDVGLGLSEGNNINGDSAISQ